MKMEESIMLIKRGQSQTTARVINSVFCSETLGIKAETNGFGSQAELIVRVPAKGKCDVSCGDTIYRSGSETRYRVVEVKDNRQPGSPLSHWKIVGRC